jgi:hypothetical protein
MAPDEVWPAASTQVGSTEAAVTLGFREAGPEKSRAARENGPRYRLIVACKASTEDWMPASADMVKSSISRLTQSL